MKIKCLLLCLILPGIIAAQQETLNFYPASHPFIQYTGRIDFSKPALPRFWQPGVYINIAFTGTACEILLNDELLWGTNHNYIEIVVDGKASRLQTKSKTDTVKIAENLSEGKHTLTICKNTEANIGWIEFAGIRCRRLIRPSPKPTRKIECIGNSITCGTGSDLSVIPCGKGAWHDQHNAWLSYGAITARSLNAQFHLSSVSGIGLMHSCCNMNVIMPQVFDKISMRNDTIRWNFGNYIPDLVTVCLGQNDGIQDSAKFVSNYIVFLDQLRKYYPRAGIFCISSPMADDALCSFMKKSLAAVFQHYNSTGDKKLFTFVFQKQYHHGCDGHPDLTEHREIAALLTEYIREKMKW